MYKRILVPVDGSETSNKALVAALQMARESDGQVRVLHFLDDLAYLSGYEYSGDVLKLAQDYNSQKLEKHFWKRVNPQEVEVDPTMFMRWLRAARRTPR